jgi:hypothetical protein
MKYNPMNFRNLFETDKGRSLWKRLSEPQRVYDMKLLSEVRQPAVDGWLGRDLKAEFGDWMLQDQIKKMAGHMVKQIMDAQGYDWESKGVPTHCKDVFVTGSRYVRRAATGTKKHVKN